MDQAAELKIRKSKALCEAAGWEFRPFVADMYGAIRSDGRALVSRVIKRCAPRLLPQSEAEAGRAIWSAVTAAVMARVAMQLGRLSLFDQPLGIPLHGLDLLSSRGPTAHTARGLPVSSSSHTNAPADMGTHTLYQPSPTELLGEEDDFLTVEVLPVGGTEKFDTMTGRIIAIPLPPPPTPGQVTTAAQCLRSPRLLRLPDGTVSPLVVSPVAPLNNTLPPVASNASLGLCDPPGPVELLPEERYRPPTCGVHSSDGDMVL